MAAILMSNSIFPMVNRENAYPRSNISKNGNIMEMFPVDWGNHCTFRIQYGGDINERLNVSNGKSCKRFPVMFPQTRFLLKDKKSLEELFPCNVFLRRQKQERVF